jgi:hypothetical protein
MNWLRKWRVWLVVALLLAAGEPGLESWMDKNGAPKYKTVSVASQMLPIRALRYE